MLILYHHNISVCAQKVRIALAEKDLSWQGVHIDLMQGEHLKPEFLKINPRAGSFQFWSTTAIPSTNRRSFSSIWRMRSHRPLCAR